MHLEFFTVAVRMAVAVEGVPGLRYLACRELGSCHAHVNVPSKHSRVAAAGCVTELTLCDRLAISKTDLCRINWKKE